MDLKKLQYFAAVAECGSFTKAAAQLRIAQPALSRQIALLEAEFGVELLLRMGRHVRLTDAGQVLLKHAHEITNSFQLARDEMQSRGRTPRGRVIFGAPPSLGSIVVPRLFERLQREEVEITLQAREGNTSFLERSIVDAELDLALLGEDPTGQWTEGKLLTREDIGLVGRRDLLDGLASGDRGFCDDVPLFVTRQVNQLWTPLLKDRGITLPLLEFDAIHGIQALTVDGRGVTLTPVGLFSTDIAAGRVSVARLSDFTLSRPLLVAWSSVRPHPRALQTVADMLAEEISALAERGVFLVPDTAPRISVAADRRGGTTNASSRRSQAFAGRSGSR
jgi:LysR family nitrogen assimilation transcriptional regulator